MDVGGYATGVVRGMGAGGSVGNRRTQLAQLNGGEQQQDYG